MKFAEIPNPPAALPPLSISPKVLLLKAVNPERAGFAQRCIYKRHPEGSLRLVIDGENEMLGVTDYRIYHLTGKMEIDQELQIVDVQFAVTEAALLVKDKRDRVLVAVAYGTAEDRARTIAFLETRKALLQIHGRST